MDIYISKLPTCRPRTPYPKGFRLEQPSRSIQSRMSSYVQPLEVTRVWSRTCAFCAGWHLQWPPQLGCRARYRPGRWIRSSGAVQSLSLDGTSCESMNTCPAQGDHASLWLKLWEVGCQAVG